MMSNNRGQIMGEIFVFILALVIFAGVLLYGYRAIYTVQEGVEDAAFVAFYDQLKAKVEQVSIDYGSVKKFASNPPSGFTEMCFLDLDRLEKDNDVLQELKSSHPLIADAVEGGTDQNLFFTPLAKTVTKLSRIEIENGFLCFEIESREISLKLEGLGDRAKLSEWT